MLLTDGLLLVCPASQNCLQVNNSVDRQDNDIVGFVLNGWARGKLLRVHLITLKKAGDPAVWHLRHGGPDAQDAKGGNLSERCGVSFPVLVEAHDKFGNRQGLPLVHSLMRLCRTFT